MTVRPGSGFAAMTGSIVDFDRNVVESYPE